MGAKIALKMISGVRINLPGEDLTPELFIERCDHLIAILDAAKAEMRKEVTIRPRRPQPSPRSEEVRL